MFRLLCRRRRKYTLLLILLDTSTIVLLGALLALATADALARLVANVEFEVEEHLGVVGIVVFAGAANKDTIGDAERVERVRSEEFAMLLAIVPGCPIT